jgi:hypothetical protein
MTTRIGIIFRELIGVLRRMAAPLYGVAVVVAFVFCPTLAAAQGSDTVYDEAGALSDPEEQRVQQAFDSVQEETGQPLYALLVPNKSVEGQEARQELLTREAADRASRRDEFDPRHSLAAVEALAERARGHREALQNDISARDALPDERYATEGALVRARESLEEYRGAHDRALGEFGQAALGEVPNPGELSSSLLEAEGYIDQADRAA